MREVFDCDHIIVRPSVDALVKMNRIGFRLQGDMNWHAHCGIFTVPIQVAVRYKVPLMLWGEHGFMDLGGMYSYNDFVEFTAKHRLEHAPARLRLARLHRRGPASGSAGRSCRRACATRICSGRKYPTDEEIDEVGVRGIYLSELRQLGWERQRASSSVNCYGWRQAQQPFERTYRTLLEPRRHARERHPRLPEVREVRLRPRLRSRLQGHPRRAS